MFYQQRTNYSDFW